MSKKIRTEAVDHLFEAILCLKNKEECYIFFEDVCTINELLSLSQRFEVAKMLMEKNTYLDISEKTGASTATISRVNRSLNYGNDGYEMVMKRLKEKEEKESNIRRCCRQECRSPFVLSRERKPFCADFFYRLRLGLSASWTSRLFMSSISFSMSIFFIYTSKLSRQIKEKSCKNSLSSSGAS